MPVVIEQLSACPYLLMMRHARKCLASQISVDHNLCFQDACIPRVIFEHRIPNVETDRLIVNNTSTVQPHPTGAALNSASWASEHHGIPQKNSKTSIHQILEDVCLLCNPEDCHQKGQPPDVNVYIYVHIYLFIHFCIYVCIYGCMSPNIQRLLGTC